MANLLDKARREMRRKLTKEEALKRCFALGACALVFAALLGLGVKAVFGALARTVWGL